MKVKLHSTRFLKNRASELERQLKTRYTAALNAFEEAYGDLTYEGFNNPDADIEKLEHNAFDAYNKIPMIEPGDELKISLGDNLVKAVNRIDEKRKIEHSYLPLEKIVLPLKIDGWC